MKILLINKFLYPKGGAEVSTLTTGRILRSHGHEVIFWGMDHPNNPSYPFSDLFVSSVDYDNICRFNLKIKAAINILYSFEAKRKIKGLLEQISPDLIHLNNIYHQISPSILDVIKKQNIPTVMTMRDYKTVCPTYSMLNKGQICEKCKNGQFYHCGVNRCNKGSFFKSLVNVAEMYLHHHIMHINDKVDLFISPSHFLRDKVIEMGHKNEVVYLSNCVDVNEFSPSYSYRENSIVYVGRLSHEKGVDTLIKAVSKISAIKLKIIGDGPLKQYLEEKTIAEGIKNVKFMGYMTGAELHGEIRNAMFLVIPSECYENNPRTVIEAFALGKPAVGARIGGIPELVRDWKTGLTYIAGNVDDLKDKITFMLENKDKIPEMGKNARSFIEMELNAEIHYHNLLEIYQKAIEKIDKD